MTHSLGLVERFCDEAVWLDAGRKRGEGDPKRVIGAYMTDVERQEEQFLAATDAKAQAEAGQAPEAAARRRFRTPAKPVADMSRATEGRWGSGGVGIEDVTFASSEGEATHVFHTGEPFASG